MSLLSEVDGIVRSMEDEKANEDEREKTRDALARIEGLERDPVRGLWYHAIAVQYPNPCCVEGTDTVSSQIDEGVYQRKSNYRCGPNNFGEREQKLTTAIE